MLCRTLQEVDFIFAQLLSIFYFPKSPLTTLHDRYPISNSYNVPKEQTFIKVINPIANKNPK